MEELSLQELKEIELGLLEQFDSFCAENNIRYFLSHGTLLGAVRYKKFIPWDDDVDLLVPREDYDRLIAIFQDSERYKLFSVERNPAYRYPFAKLCDMSTRKEEFHYNNGVDLGVDLDIFPLDAWNDDLHKARKEARRISRNMFGLGLSKLDKPDSLNPLKRAVKGVVMAFAKMLGSRYFIQNILKEACKEEQHGKNYLGCKVWCIYGERGIIPAEAFAETIDMEFEGKKYPVPKGYDTYLTCLYGDYLPEPPKEKQKTHHAFHAYRV